MALETESMKTIANFKELTCVSNRFHKNTQKEEFSDLAKTFFVNRFLYFDVCHTKHTYEAYMVHIRPSFHFPVICLLMESKKTLKG